MQDKLTESLARKVLPPAQGQSFIWDSEVKGFALRITKGGAKSFVVDYRAGGRQRRISIGSSPDWTVAAARQAAKDMKREVDRGRDPMGERHAEREAPTMSELWERYEREHLPSLAPRSQTDQCIMWEKIILPRLGKTKVAAVTHEDVDSLHRDITEIRKTPVRANRTVEVLRKAFNLAIRWKWRSDNPASGVRRNAEEQRSRYLDRTEIIALARALDEHPERISADAIRLLMLTGARRGEVLNATWGMFDLENGIWVKPSAHTKQRREHRVPLNSPALDLLRVIKKNAEESGTPVSKEAFVFPGADGKPLTDIKRTWLSVCRKAGLATRVPRNRRDGAPKIGNESAAMVWESTVRLHDLRHSFASVLVSGGASLPLIGQMLGHSQVQTTQRYAHLFDETMRQAAEKVGIYVLSAPQKPTGEPNSVDA